MLLIGIFLLFGGKDKSRLFIYMLPIVTLLTVTVIQDFQKWLPVWKFWTWLLSAVFLHLTLASWFHPFDDFENYLDLQVPEHSYFEGAAGFSRATFVTFAFFLVSFFLVRPERRNQERETERLASHF